MVLEKPLPLFSGVFNFQVDKSKFCAGDLLGSKAPPLSTFASWVTVRFLM